MDAVIAAEKAPGYEPRDVSADRIGYDIESKDLQSGSLRFIEVKGRVDGADTITVTRNEILMALNKPEAFVLAIVCVSSGFAHPPRYVRTPFKREPDFGATSVTYWNGISTAAPAGPTWPFTHFKLALPKSTIPEEVYLNLGSAYLRLNNYEAAIQNLLGNRD